MRETCVDCGKSWGVTMKPREVVRCQACARPQPWRRPLWYWQARIWNFPFGALIRRSPEWWDSQTSLQDLRAAVGFAREFERPAQLMLDVAQ